MPTWPPSHHAPRTVRPLTWPNQRDWSKDTSYRTADLAQVRSATPTCRRTPHHQYGKRGGKRGSTLPYGRPGTGKVGNPHLQAHASPPVQQAWQEARQHAHKTSPHLGSHVDCRSTQEEVAGAFEAKGVLVEQLPTLQLETAEKDLKEKGTLNSSGTKAGEEESVTEAEGLLRANYYYLLHLVFRS
ncbi:hypothetical protein BHE74_00014663 [Ensete ventricosum]|nr:hypothetical protein BHE74_00014663 [Ensete ventricosum]